MKRIAIGLAAVAVVLSACQSELFWQGYRIDNRTDVRISVSAIVNGGPEDVLAPHLDPGQVLPIDGYPGKDCVRILLIARDVTGHEVDRRDGDACLGQTWVVTGARHSSSRSELSYRTG
jgi:hypothetical protein